MIRKYRNLANLITLTRILGVGSIFWLTPYSTSLMLIWVVLIFTLISVTDFLDGWVARRLDIESDLGKILDPLADKILVLVFLPLLEMGVITAFPVFIILAREFAIMAMRVFSAKQGTIVAAKLSGKIKTGFTLPVCGILLGRVSVQEVPLPAVFEPIEWLRLWVVSWPHWFVTALIWTTVLVTIWSFLDYFWKFLWQRWVTKAGGDEIKARRFLYALVPNSLSLLNLLFGVLACYFSYSGWFSLASLLILMGVLLDGFDGKIARKLGVYSSLGAKLDSRADYVTFGVAPAVFIFYFLMAFVSVEIWIAGVLAILYYGAVHFRLWRFNTKGGHSDYFEGLPSPIGASLVVLGSQSMVFGDMAGFIAMVVLSFVVMASTLSYAHNRISRSLPVLKWLYQPSFIFYLVCLVDLIVYVVLDLSVAPFVPVYDILIACSLFYVFSPLYLKKRVS